MNDSTGPNKALIGIIVVILIGIVVGGVYVVSQSSNEENVGTSQSSTTSGKSGKDAETNEVASAGNYADGTYEATGRYSSPGGRESINVSLTITEGKVTDSTVTSEAKNPTAKGYQADFISGYKTVVGGKSIDDIELDTVAGSSLTPNGFEDALQQIKQDAAA